MSPPNKVLVHIDSTPAFPDFRPGTGRLNHSLLWALRAISLVQFSDNSSGDAE